MPVSLTTLETQLAAAATEHQQIDALNALAEAVQDTDPKRGLDLAQSAYNLAQANQYAAGLAHSLVNLSQANFELGNFITAQSQGLEALTHFETLNDPLSQAKTLYILGRVEVRLANQLEALEYLFRGLEIARSLGDRAAEARLFYSIGVAYHHLGDYLKAVEMSRKSLAIDRELGNQREVATDLNSLAVHLYEVGQYAESLACGQEGLQLARTGGYQLIECYVLGTLGETYAHLGEYAQTIDYCSRAREKAIQLGAKYLEMAALHVLGQAYRGLQQPETAAAYLHQTLALAEALANKKDIFECHRRLAEIYESQGALAQALTHYKQFYAVRETVFNEERDRKIQSLEVRHRTATVRKEAEVYQLKNVALEQEIAERKRVEARLRASEERYRRLAANLQVAAQVGQVVTSILDMEQALPRVVTLIQERFGYYHVGIFLLKHSGTQAVLQAASGPLAETLLDRKPALPVGGRSLIGQVTQTGRPIIAQDVAAEPLYHASATLTETRAEAVLPLLSGETILGALDVESTEPNAFSPDTISILTTLADQIAVAVHNAQLHAAEKAHAHELELAYRALQENQAKLMIAEKMASLGRLTAGIAHELNTPLATIRTSITLADQLIQKWQQLEETPNASPDRAEVIAQLRQSIQLAARAAERAAGFVRGIKSQTRNLAAQTPQRFNAVNLIAETLMLLEHDLLKAKCRLSFEPAGPRIELYGSPGGLAQVMMSLISNAIEASRNRGGGPITVRLGPDAAGWLLQVSDEGSGIDPEHLTRIFDPMFTTKPFGEGAGLGLTIVHDIVNGVFGGAITVESQLGAGTTVDLHFPRPPEVSQPGD